MLARRGAHHLHPGAPDGELLAGLAAGVRDPPLAEHVRGAGIDDQLRVGVLFEQRGQAVDVEVVEVLVGDEDRVEPLEGLPALREGPGVEQDAGRPGVDHDAGVPEVHEFGGAHGPGSSPWGGSANPVPWSTWHA